MIYIPIEKTISKVFGETAVYETVLLKDCNSSQFIENRNLLQIFKEKKDRIWMTYDFPNFGDQSGIINIERDSFRRMITLKSSLFESIIELLEI